MAGKRGLQALAAEVDMIVPHCCIKHKIDEQ